MKRNLAVLEKQPVPPYFLAYSVYETPVVAVVRVVRRDDGRPGQPVADLRRGHPDRRLRTRQHARDPRRAAPPAGIGRAAVPLTDSQPGCGGGRLGRDRPRLPPGGRAAGPREDEPRGQGEGGGPGARLLARGAAGLGRHRRRRSSSTRRTGRRGCADSRRCSPRTRCVLRGEAALSVEANTRYMVTTEGSRLLTGDTACRLSIQALTKADDGMELPRLHDLLRARRWPACRPRPPARGRPRAGRPCSPGFAPRRSSIRIRARPSCRAAPRACSSTRSSATASRASRQKTRRGRADVRAEGRRADPARRSSASSPIRRCEARRHRAGRRHYDFDDEGVRARRVDGRRRTACSTSSCSSRSPLPRFPQLERPRPRPARACARSRASRT